MQDNFSSTIENSNYNPYYKSFNVPSSNVTVNAQIRPKKSRLHYLTIFFFLILLGTIATFVYFFFFRVEEKVNTIQKTNQVEEENLSREDVEAKNLDSIEKNPVDISTLSSNSWLEKDELEIILDTQANISTLLITSKEVDGLLTVAVDSETKEIILDKNFENLTPVLKFDYLADYNDENLNSAMIDKHITDIMSELNDINYTGVEVDASYMVYEGYYDFLSALKLKLEEDNKKLAVSITAKWGDEPNYKKYFNLYPEEFFNIDYAKLSNSVDEIRIKAFDYTTQNSALAGSISPRDWVEQVIQFTLSKDIPQSKIILGINTKGFEWTERETSNNYLNNYVWVNPETSNIYSKDEVDEIIADSSNLDIIESTNEKIVKLEKEEGKFILVYPEENYINSLKALAADYGLWGIILR